MNKNCHIKMSSKQPRKEHSKKYPVSTIYLQVIGSGAVGCPPSLYVFTEHCRFLFNCGEGTQRLCYEHKVKLSQMEHIFVTSKSWRNTGGLPGALLTLQDTGVPNITVHGPAGLESLYLDTKNFMRFFDLKIDFKSYEREETVFVENASPLIVEAVPLVAKQNSDADSIHCALFKEFKEDVDDMYEHEKKPGWKRKRQESNETPENKRQRLLKSIESRDVAVAYICRPTPKAGALLIDRCREEGVPNGPLLGQLKSGKDVTLSSGKVVKTDDVTKPDEPGLVFIVLEVPTLDHLDSLLSNDAFKTYQKDTSRCHDDVAQLVVHFSPSDIMQDLRMKKWMKLFPTTTNHVILNSSNTCMGSQRVHQIQHQLNHIYQNSFPILYTPDVNGNNGKGCVDGKDRYIDVAGGSQDDVVKAGGEVINGNGNGFCKADIEDDYLNVTQAGSLLTYHIRPIHSKFDKSKLVRLDPQSFIKECYIQKQFADVLKTTKNKLEEISCPLEGKNDEFNGEEFPNLVFLGTGSCIPNKTRNTSAILLNMSCDTSILLDCGEGTSGQMYRLWGPNGAKEYLLKIKVIYVSHLHADHHIGLIGVLLARKKAINDAKEAFSNSHPVYLLAPVGIVHYLQTFSCGFEDIADQFKLVSNSEFMCPTMDLPTSLPLQVMHCMNVLSLQTCHVHHCKDSYGIAMQHKTGWKLVYSGDTRPSKNLVEIGSNCDILIHEATMEDDLSDDALAKRHCTTAEALQVAMDMGASHTILTHFSQRYAKLPLLSKVPHNVTLAFDNMKVCMKDLYFLPHLYPVLKVLFSEDFDEMLKKRAKYQVAKLNRKLKIQEQL